MELRTVLVALPALQKLATLDLSIKCLYWVRKLLSQIDGGPLKIFNEIKNELLEKYGQHIGDGKYNFEDNEKLKIYKEEYEKLLSTEIEREFCRPVITDSEFIRMSSNDMIALEPFITFNFTETEEEQT